LHIFEFHSCRNKKTTIEKWSYKKHLASCLAREIAFYEHKLLLWTYFVKALCVKKKWTSQQLCFYFILRLRTQAIKSRGSSVVKLSKRGVNEKETFWDSLGSCNQGRELWKMAGCIYILFKSKFIRKIFILIHIF